MKTFAYLRVSTLDQETEKNKTDILQFANTRNLGKVHFVEEKVSGAKAWRNRRIAQLVTDMNPGDVLIVPELSRLGRSVVDILDILKTLSEKDTKVFSVKEGFQLNGKDIQSKVMRTMFALFAEIERDLITARTKEGMAAAKAKGAVLGRPKGLGRSRLDKYQAEIVALLRQGSTKTFVAKRYGVTVANLYHYINRHNLDVAPQV